MHFFPCQTGSGTRPRAGEGEPSRAMHTTTGQRQDEGSDAQDTCPGALDAMAPFHAASRREETGGRGREKSTAAGKRRMSLASHSEWPAPGREGCYTTFPHGCMPPLAVSRLRGVAWERSAGPRTAESRTTSAEGTKPGADDRHPVFVDSVVEGCAVCPFDPSLHRDLFSAAWRNLMFPCEKLTVYGTRLGAGWSITGTSPCCYGSRHRPALCQCRQLSRWEASYHAKYK